MQISSAKTCVVRPKCIKASFPSRVHTKRESCVESQEIPGLYVRLFTDHTPSDRLWHATIYTHTSSANAVSRAYDHPNTYTHTSSANAVSRAYGRPNSYTHCGYHRTSSVYWQQLYVFQPSTGDVC